MADTILKIGMPAGSLANPKRGGNLLQLLHKSGFETKGYETGGPSEFKIFPYFYGWDGRPQEFGAQLGIGELDVAISGDDWILERTLEMKLEYKSKIELEKVLSLRRGGVRIVGICNPQEDVDDIFTLLKLLSTKDVITVVSELPYLAVNWLQERFATLGIADKYSKFSVQKYKTPAKIKKGIVVYETWGKTEAKVKNGGADLGLEITQSGSAIRSYGLKVIDTVMESESSVWINPKIKKDKVKKELLEMFLLNLYGTVNAENKVLLLFNVANINRPNIEKYLKANYLFADEPTINEGKSFTEYSVQVDTTNVKAPLAKIRYDLAKLKAVNIDTLPISSSIVSIDDVLEFK